MFTFCTKSFYFYIKLTVKHCQPRNNTESAQSLSRSITVRDQLVKITRGQPQNDFLNTEFRSYSTGVVNRHTEVHKFQTMRGVARELFHIFLCSSFTRWRSVVSSSEHKNRQKVVLDFNLTDICSPHSCWTGQSWLISGGDEGSTWTLQGLFDSAVNAALRSDN